MSNEQRKGDPQFTSAVLTRMSGESASIDEITAVVTDMMTFHPWQADQLEAGKPVRAAATALIIAIVTNVPPGADRSAAIRDVRNALYSSNAAITHHGRY